MSGTIWNPVNWSLYLTMVFLALVILLVHVLLSLVVAASVLQFWIGAVAVGIVVPFALVRSGLSAIGYQAMAFIISCVVRLIAISTVVALGNELVTGVMIPGPGEELRMIDLVAADISGVVVMFLAWQASSWASQIARAAPGGTGVTALVTAAAVSAISGGVRAAGSTIGSEPSSGGGSSAGSSSGSGGKGSGRVGRRSSA